MTAQLKTIESENFVSDLYAAVDHKDVVALGGFLADDVAFKLGNLDAIYGKQAVLGANSSFFKSIAEMAHSIDGVWAMGNEIICAGYVQYKRLDKSELSIPFSTILKLRDRRISEYQVYVDISPL